MSAAIAAVIVLASVILHELAHGYAALLNGDETAKRSGRLSFNPIRHVDLIGTIIVPAVLILTKSPVLFGWAKPVPVNPMFFRNRKKGVITVSLAGPSANLALVALAAVLWRILPLNELLATALVYMVLINLILGIFNLIPIPPLDGSHVLGLFLPKKIRCHYYALNRYGFVLIFILLWMGMFNTIVLPVVNKCTEIIF